MILLAGAALGIAYNYAGRLAAPPRGLPWVEGLAAPAWLSSLDPGRAPSSAAPDTAESMQAPALDGGGGEGPRPGSAAEDSAVQASGLPVFPDLDQPMDVPLRIVRQLVEARAALVLDTRGHLEFASGHIPGAVSLPAAALDSTRVRWLESRGRPIVTYCDGTDCDSAANLARLLVDFGKRKVLVFRGGWTEWATAGLPVERGPGGAP